MIGYVTLLRLMRFLFFSKNQARVAS